MIRPAKIEEIPQILDLSKACAQHMISKGIFQWNDHYPSKEAFMKDIARSELFVLEHQSTIQGCIAISSLMDEEYADVEWLTPNTNNLYIHRLAILPEHQGKGKARLLMDAAEQKARDKQYTSIRLDTFSKNKRNQRFYETRGYQKLGTVYFPKQSIHPFYCYELVL
ncbi:MAG: GNAT family N-acetyltransferase [Eudoraea sp.]|nr:GNAT family N-acetyltransferase [Eudoraea sp.]